MRLAVHPYINAVPFSPYNPGPWDNSKQRHLLKDPRDVSLFPLPEIFVVSRNGSSGRPGRLYFSHLLKIKPSFLWFYQDNGILGLIEAGSFFFSSLYLLYFALSLRNEWIQKTEPVIPEEPINADLIMKSLIWFNQRVSHPVLSWESPDFSLHHKPHIIQ